MKAEEFDKRFDEGEDISRHLDVSRAKGPVQEMERVNVDFPLPNGAEKGDVNGL